MDVRLSRLAATQFDVVARWQLLALGWTNDRVHERVRRSGWRLVHRGVYALTQAPLTREQRWMAATLSTRTSALSHASAGAFHGIRLWEGSFETITRPGSGGPRRIGTLLVCRSLTLGDAVVRSSGIRVTTPERTVIDLAATLHPRQAARVFREAVRLKLMTTGGLNAALDRHPNARGAHMLRDLAARYGDIPYTRTRSNAEARGLEILHDAGIELPLVNARIAGEEADYAWLRRRVIIEIDGPQYHLFADEDARKQRRWEAAGFTVHRVPSQTVFEDPAILIEQLTRSARSRAPSRPPRPRTRP